MVQRNTESYSKRLRIFASGQRSWDVTLSVWAKDCKILAAALCSALGNFTEDGETYFLLFRKYDTQNEIES
jgi:uncharacterized protein YqjF (DUF2071 family)